MDCTSTSILNSIICLTNRKNFEFPAKTFESFLRSFRIAKKNTVTINNMCGAQTDKSQKIEHSSEWPMSAKAKKRHNGKEKKMFISTYGVLVVHVKTHRLIYRGQVRDQSPNVIQRTLRLRAHVYTSSKSTVKLRQCAWHDKVES